MTSAASSAWSTLTCSLQLIADVDDKEIPGAQHEGADVHLLQAFESFEVQVRR